MNKCKLHYFRSVGKFFVFFEHEIVKRSRNVALAYNVGFTNVFEIIKIMELFTEIEFKVTEFDKIDKVLYFLTNEGWEIINTKEFSITRPNKPKEITARKYKFRRTI